LKNRTVLNNATTKTLLCGDQRAIPSVGAEKRVSATEKKSNDGLLDVSGAVMHSLKVEIQPSGIRWIFLQKVLSKQVEVCITTRFADLPVTTPNVLGTFGSRL
jgi:hypothetical protein